MFETIDQARAYFKDDKFATNNGMTIDELGDDYAVCSMTITPDHLNANHAVMGGVYYTLSDFAFAVITNHIHQVSVGLDSNITFHSPAKGEKMYARASLIKTGRTTSYCEVKITDDTGRLCTSFTGTAYKL